MGGNPQYLPINPEDLAYLSGRCPRLRTVIAALPPVQRLIEPDPFAAVVSTIVGQQISGKAQDGILRRFDEKFGAITVENLREATFDELRSVGVSGRKAETILRFISAVQDGSIALNDFGDLPDQEIINQLTTLKGVGVWTAEMVLIFSLLRPNVLSFGDLGIRRGLERLYGKNSIDRAFFDACAERYAPKGTIASLYLWEVASPKFPSEISASLERMAHEESCCNE